MHQQPASNHTAALKKWGYRLALIGSCLASLINSCLAYGYSADDLYSINTNTPFFDITATACGGAGSGAATTTQAQGQQIAQTFIIGFDANTPKPVITDLASRYHIGGMYIINTNDGAAAGFDKTFYDSLNQAAGTPLVTASDEEGAVKRYTYPSGTFPTAAQMTAIASRSGSTTPVQAIGQKVGQIMSSNGLNTDLAPVLDLRDVAISGRSFSSNPTTVGSVAGAFASGLQSSSIKPIFKHFPGFDSTTSGSTDNQKVVMSGSIDQTVAPYKQMIKNFPNAGIMLSNMYANKLDAANPSSLSAPTVQYLRSTLGFKGMITTDDLSVNTVTSAAGSLPKAVAKALAAGVTMPLFTLDASSTTTAENNLNQIISAVESDPNASQAISGDNNIITAFKGVTSSSTTSPLNEAGASCCSTASTFTPGKDNEGTIFNFLTSKGLSAPQAAGIVGNIDVESGGTFDPSITQGFGHADYPTDGVGFGLSQWTFTSRQAPLVALAQKETKKPSNLYVQMDYIWQELTGGYSSSLTALKQTTTAAQAAVSFMITYEAPADHSPTGPNAIERSKRADKALQLYGAGAASTGTTVSSGGSSNCGGAMPGVGMGKGAFTTNTSINYPGVAAMLALAQQVTNRSSAAFQQICGSSCYRMCDHLAGGVWGHANSGYATAADHWAAMKAGGHAHPGDRNPPVGALLFYYTGDPAGHIAVYLGNNKVLSNDVNGNGGAYIVDASAMENGPWRLTYLGWSDPVF